MFSVLCVCMPMHACVPFDVLICREQGDGSEDDEADVQLQGAAAPEEPAAAEPTEPEPEPEPEAGQDDVADGDLQQSARHEK